MLLLGVGGSIGTGLLLGSGAAVHIAGPAVILSYLLGALITATVAAALAELASVHPEAGSFGVYGEVYLNPWAGFVARYGYWFAVVTAVGGELLAVATYMHYWVPGTPAWVWVLAGSLLLLGVNLLHVGRFAWCESGLALIKLIVLTGFIALGAGLLLAHRVPAQYLSGPGATPFLPHGGSGMLLGVSLALFSFLGVEMVAIAAGEARSRPAVAAAVWRTFIVLALVYVGAMSILVGVVPWSRLGVAESPFVTVFRHAHVPAVSAFMNFVVVTAALSGANASFYVASRMLYSLAGEGLAPRHFARLTATGQPRNALLASGLGMLLALVVSRLIPEGAFLYIIGASLFGGMAAWLVTLAAHLRFRQRLSVGDRERLPVRSPFGASGSVFGFVAIVLALAATWETMRVTLISGAVGLVLLTVAWLLRPRQARRSAR